jgi:hypothetical protein
MKQKYPNDGNCARNSYYWQVETVPILESGLSFKDGGLYRNEYKLGGSSFAQTLNTIGKTHQQLKMPPFQKRSIPFRN